MYEQIKQITERYINEGYFPSAVVSVFDAKGTIERCAFGKNPDGTAVNTDTVYDVASLSKIANSTQALLAMDAGQLKLETLVCDVLPEIKARPNLYNRLHHVTIYQLLTHSSGILDWYPFYVQRGKDFYDVFDNFIGDTEIMEGTVYSDMNLMLVGKVLEKIKGKPLAACLDDFREFLGAKRLEYNPVNTENMAPSSYGNGIEEEMCAERNLTFDGWRSKEVPTLGAVNDGNAHYFFDGIAGHAGVFADVDAYERIGRLYLTTDSPLMLRSMTEQEDGRGLGWQISESLFPEGCGHTGFTGTSIWVSRKNGVGAIAFTNRLCFPDHNGTGTNAFREEIHRMVLKNL